MPKKELRETAPYLITYWIMRTIGKLLSPIAFFKFSIYGREPVTLLRTGMWSLWVKIGKGTKIDSGVGIRYNPNNLEIGKYCHIDIGVQLEVHKKLKIGDYVHIAPNAYIQSGDEVIIEDYAGIGNGATIYTKSNTYKEGEKIPTLMSGSAPLHKQKYTSGPVRLKKNAWLGPNTLVLPGVTIGKNSKVGAGSIVSTDIPDNVVAIGNPARPIKKI